MYRRKPRKVITFLLLIKKLLKKTNLPKVKMIKITQALQYICRKLFYVVVPLRHTKWAIILSISDSTHQYFIPEEDTLWKIGTYFLIFNPFSDIQTWTNNHNNVTHPWSINCCYPAHAPEATEAHFFPRNLGSFCRNMGSFLQKHGFILQNSCFWKTN